MKLDCFQPDISWVRPNSYAASRIEAAAGKLQASELQAPEIHINTQRGRIDVAALAMGSERCFRRWDRNDGGNRGGVTLYFQCALLGSESQADVDRRAMAALRAAKRYEEDGVPVSVIACWVSESVNQSGRYCVAWKDITGMGIEMAAALIDEEVFRNAANGIMTQRGNRWPDAYGSHGGAGRTVRDAERFKHCLKQGGALIEDGIVLNWNRDNEPLD